MLWALGLTVAVSSPASDLCAHLKNKGLGPLWFMKPTDGTP